MLIKKIHKRTDYQNISRNGSRLHTKNLIIQFRKTNNFSRTTSHIVIGIGVIASKKVGNAVKRNYVKRRIKAVCKSAIEKLTNNVDLVIVGKSNIVKEKFFNLNFEIRRAFEEIDKRV